MYIAGGALYLGGGILDGAVPLPPAMASYRIVTERNPDPQADGWMGDVTQW